MAPPRVAPPGSRTDQVLALHPARKHEASRSGAIGQTSLDRRARLPGTEARTRTGPLRRTRLARVSPSCDSLYCGLWLPGSRTEPFFPLRSRRSSELTRRRNAAQVPPSGFARYAWSGITPGPLLRFDKPSHEFCSDNSRVVLFAELLFTNTVVLAGCGKRSVAAQTLSSFWILWLREDRNWNL